MEKPIKDFEDYIINDSGDMMHTVWSSKREIFLKPKIDNNGYYIFCLSKDNVKYFFSAHRLLAEAFIPNPDNKPCIDHIIPVSNGGDNSLSNLRWVTHKENSNNPLSLINNRNSNIQKKAILQLDMDGNIIAEYSSIGEAARTNGYSGGNIHRCLNGGYFRKDRKCGIWQNINSYKGFKWIYKQ